MILLDTKFQNSASHETSVPSCLLSTNYKMQQKSRFHCHAVHTIHSNLPLGSNATWGKEAAKWYIQ